jgi:iron-sulfur cluster assembly protein
MSSTLTEKATITLTEKAASEVKRIIEEQKKAGELPEDKVYLRLHVVGGGCSGFQNRLNLDAQVNEKDEVFEVHGVPVVVDKRSLMYLNGVTVDFIDSIQGRGFHIANPNAKSTCGCGSSFSM